jgi:L-threonylcarbamoyladenylate synthase
MKNDIYKAIEILNHGGIVIFPTDTAFAIGCRIDDEKAVQKLFQIRKRPQSQATSVLVEGLDMAQQYIQPITQEVNPPQKLCGVKEKLIDRFWPGALTVVLPCLKEKVPKLVRGGSDNLGVRMPNHQIALSLIRGVGVPLLGPSANFHGAPTPFQFQDLDQELVKLVDFVVEGECSAKQASTVIDCSIKPWKIIRQGVTKI